MHFIIDRQSKSEKLVLERLADSYVVPGSSQTDYYIQVYYEKIINYLNLCLRFGT